ncbi:MAG: hypothetical protein HOY75_14350 [Streptomyces sp.]|nr:hypothetical protein [Streptomyces sp.]
MPALAPDTIRTATKPPPDLTDYLRQPPDPVEALALVEPLVDEYTGLPVQLGDALRALARARQEHQDVPRTAQVDCLITELRTAVWKQTDQHALHYVLDDLGDVHGRAATSDPGAGRCQ